VDAEIAADPESYEWLVNTANAVQALEATGAGDGARVLPLYRRRAVMGGLGALLAAAAALIVVVRTPPAWWQGFQRLDGDPLAGLVEAVGEHRYTEARLAGAFRYGPLRPVMRGESPSSVDTAVLAAAAELQRRAGQSTSPADRHAAAVARILVGGDEVSTAIAQLEALAAESPSAVYQSDLAAAYLTRWQTAGRDADLARALELTEAAVRTAPDLAEAQAAWKAFLARAPGDAWAPEARRHLEALTGAEASPPR
jgi:hypothetical protein